MLGQQTRLGWMLAAANLLLAVAQFAEPVLFGRIIDALSAAPAAGIAATPPAVWRLFGAWVAFGLFTIACGVMVALHADRLAHRQRQAVLTSYFEHILQLPLTFHSGIHSGRLMKVMLQGTDALWQLWLGFFREHFAAIVSLVVMLPLSLYLNWRLAIPLFLLCVVFTVLTTLVVRKTSTMQTRVEQHFGDLAARASDALGNVALVQSYVRIDAEVQDLRGVSERLLAAQIPVLSWWAVVAVMTRASTTLTILAIFVVGIVLHGEGLASIGEIVMFVSFATMLIQKLEQVVAFINSLFMEAPRLQEFFDVLDAVPAVRDRPDAIDPGRIKGLVEFADVTFSYDGKRPAVEDLSFTALPGQTIALVGPTGAGKSTAIALLHRAFDPQSGFIRIDGMDIRGISLSCAAPEYRSGVPGSPAVQSLDRRQSARRQARRQRPGDAPGRAAGAGARLHRSKRAEIRCQCRRTRPHALGRRAPAPVDRPRPAEGPADPHSRRGHQRARRRDRGQGQRRARHLDAGTHHLRHRPSAVDHSQRHPHSGVRPGQDHRERNL